MLGSMEDPGAGGIKTENSGFYNRWLQMTENMPKMVTTKDNDNNDITNP